MSPLLGDSSSPHAPSWTDAELARLMRDSAGDDPARRAQAALWAQSGRYACSHPQIDWIVDAAQSVPGVLGAQIAGAGLGGCAMILTRQQAVPALMKTLRDGYYRPRDLPFDVHVCVPVAGSGLLRV